MAGLSNVMEALVGDRSTLTRLANYGLGKSSGSGVKIKSIPIPSISENEVLVRVAWVALNPTDFKHVDILSPRGAIIGCDFAGTVAKVGSQAANKWAVGDRIAGMVHGGLFPDRGSFAQYLKTSGDLAWKVPPGVSDEDATTFGVSAITAMLALNTRLDVPWLAENANQGQGPSRGDTPILIYSGATAAGIYSIQLAKLAGLTVVATASPRSFDLVKRYGADEVFDYRDQAAVDQIIRAYPNLDRAMDCFSEGNSTEFCAKCVRKNKGKVVTLLDSGKSTMDGVQIEFILGYTVFGSEFQWLPPFGPKFQKIPSDNEALRRFYSTFPTIVTQLRPPPLKIIDPGLENLATGLEMLRQGQVSGTKLVARL
ncbi:hypothetical protein N7481_004092 [Penicillium waksmanii]|uniref:uncharacterized protein n=1 Tax=Penicillium waksmanii TaxID=69791 RepID=UPI002546D152|nr:uncharacterized protein N7481_004092 [Penicillium waksmanii]KAJ5988882.1 hypothetical protein N7481_004092 [Penicillium waksmanii]